MMHFFYKYKNIVINVSQCLCVLIFLAFLIVKALGFAIYVPTQHLDGAFQTASSLYRLNSGQLPGRDFFPYLGIGPVFAIFPLFKAMGSTLTASVFSSYSVVYLLSWLGISIIYYLIFQSKNFLHSLLAGAITYFLTFYLYQLPLFSIFAYEVSPGNSLKPVRAALPYLAAIATYLILTRCKNWILRGIFAGCIIAFSSLWSNDFAIPTMGIFSIFYCFYFYQNDKANWCASIILFVLSAAISSCLLFILATGGHPLEFIAYNFHDVAKDQWWYFGPYVDERRVYSVFDLYKLINRETYFPLLILFFNFIMAFKNRNLKFWLLFMIGCGLFAGGALTSIGGSISGYFIFAYYWAMIVTSFVGLKISLFFWQKIIKNFNSSFLLKGQPFFSAGFTFILMVVFCNIFLNVNHSYQDRLSHAQNDKKVFFVAELGGYLGVEWKDYLAYAKMHKDSKVIEEYWGIWSAYNKSASQWPVDSVIHALGDVRSEAKGAVAQADVIITSGVAVAAHWRAWSMSINYWFYGDIFKNRTADFVSPTTVVWRKIDKPRYNQPIDCIISDDKASISVNSIAHKYYAVTLNYQFNGSGRLLLMAQNNISSTNGRELGFFPIPPETGTISYPILTTQDGVNNFAFLPIGGKNMTLIINTCDANELTDVVFDALNLSARFYLTDRNWIHGVGRSHAGFFVPNERSYINRYQIGKYVLFPNGNIRKIISVKPFSQYLNIEVEGAVLDAERVGLPLKFKVLDKPPL